MKRRVWIEGLIFIAISIVSLMESLRLIIYKDPQTLYDLLGPGNYLLAVSLGLMLTGIIYIIVHLAKLSPTPPKEESTREMKLRLYGSFASLILYIIFITIFGYFVATLVFFLIVFWIVGVKPWFFNIILSIVLTAVYYFTFVKYCSMVFPHGILF